VVIAAKNYIQRKNQELMFVEKTVGQIGYPRWNKAMVKTIAKTSTGRGNSRDSTEVVYVPFVRDSQNYVNASLIIAINPADTSFSYLCDWQYRNYGFDTISSSWNAKDVFHFFSTFDYLIFNRATFKINDPELFGNPGTNNISIVKMHPDSSSSGKGFSTLSWIGITSCVIYDVCYYPVGQEWCNGGNCTVNCEYYNHSEEECITDWIWVGSGGGGSWGNGGSGNGGSSGGGSGGGDGTPPEPDCGPGSGRSNNVIPPCEPGWEPIEEDPEVYIIILDSTFLNTNMHCSYNGLKLKSQHFRDLNNTFDGVNGNALILHMLSLPDTNAYAITRGFGQNRFVITTDPKVDTSSNLFRMLILSHEFIHARLYYALELAGFMLYDTYGNPSLDTSNGVLNIPLVNLPQLSESERLRVLINQYNSQISSQPSLFSKWAHFLFGTASFSTDTYRLKLQNMLFESENWNIAPSTFINYFQSKFGTNWKNKICEYLSWYGLHDTPGSGFTNFLANEGITQGDFENEISYIKLNGSKICQ